MSIKVFSGIPGSGKTYRVVYDIFKKEGAKYFVCHNIDGFRGAAVPGGVVRTHEEVARALGVSVGELWTGAVQKRLCELAQSEYGRPVLMVVDEAQLLFGEKNRSVLEWLSQHRHYGQDVWLVCQNIMMLDRKIQDLVEVEIRGKRGAAIGLFLYQWRINGETYHTDRRPKDKVVQAAYLSAVGHNAVSRSKLLYFAVACVLACLCGGGWFLFGGGFSLGVSPSIAGGPPAPQAERAERASGGRPAIGQPGAVPVGAAAVPRVAPVAGVWGRGGAAQSIPARRVVGPGRVASLSVAELGRRLSGAAPVEPPMPGPAGGPGVEPVVSDSGAIPAGWRFAGLVRGRPYVHNGRELRLAAELVRDGWSVVGVTPDEGLSLVSSQGAEVVRAGEVNGTSMWFGVEP